MREAPWGSQNLQVVPVLQACTGSALTAAVHSDGRSGKHEGLG